MEQMRVMAGQQLGAARAWRRRLAGPTAARPAAHAAWLRRRQWSFRLEAGQQHGRARPCAQLLLTCALQLLGGHDGDVGGEGGVAMLLPLGLEGCGGCRGGWGGGGER